MNSTWQDAGLNSKDNQTINTTRTLTLTEDTSGYLVYELYDSAGQLVSRTCEELTALPKLEIDVFWFVDTSGSMRGTPSANVDASFAAMQTQLGAMGASTTIKRYNNSSGAENVFRDFRSHFNTIKSLRRSGSSCHIIGASDTGVWTSNINDTAGLIRQLRADGPCDLWMYAVAGGERGDAFDNYGAPFIDLYGDTSHMLRDTSSIVSGIAANVKPVEMTQSFTNVPDQDTYTVSSYLSDKCGGGSVEQQQTTTVSVADRTGPACNITVTQTLFPHGRNKGKSPVVTTLN